ncbi:MAG: ORF6N domain-containing protein [Verrucomicrobiae bacterium]
MKFALLLESLILTIREKKILLDADLTLICGMPTKALNQAVKRNAEQFPADFLFQISPDEKSEAVTICDHIARLLFS